MTVDEKIDRLLGRLRDIITRHPSQFYGEPAGTQKELQVEIVKKFMVDMGSGIVASQVLDEFEEWTNTASGELINIDWLVKQYKKEKGYDS